MAATNKIFLDDKNGQAVVNAGAGIAKKQTVSNDLYAVDRTGQKVLATTGKDTYATVKLDQPESTIQPEVPGDSQTVTPTTYTEQSENSNISSMLGNQSKDQELTNSWDKEAKQYADKLYQQGKAEAESEYSVKTSELKTQAQQSQEELEMQRYTNSQTSDKLGWTGGYVLDQQRQMNVLKAGIQAQLFNTQELNKLGLESSLAAARLNADLKNMELAHQYYQDAINNALNKAQTTGFYLSPEAEDYLTQQRAAEQIMSMNDENSAEYAQAKQVYDFVENYFSENGLSKQGKETIAYINAQTEANLAYLEKEKVAMSYIAAAENSDAYKEGAAGLYYDANGNKAYLNPSEEDPFGDGIDIVNFSSITPERLAEICDMNPEGKNASFYEQCIDYKLGEIAKLYNNYLSTQGLTASENSWTAFQENPTNKALLENFEAIKGIDITTFTKETILNGCAAPLTNFTLDANLNITFTKDTLQDTGNNTVAKSIQDKLAAATNSETKASNSISLDDIKTNETFGEHISFETAQKIRGVGMDDDFDINFKVDGKTTKNYDIDVDWEVTTKGSWAVNEFSGSAEDFNKAQTYLKNTYPNQTTDTFVIYNNQLWYYNIGVGKWGYVQQGAGGKKLFADLKTAAQGKTPDRWK